MKAIADNGTIRIYDSYLYKESIREIDGRLYDPDDKAWIVPLNKKNAYTIGLLGAELDEELKELAKQEDDNDVLTEPIVKPKIKGSLYAHQVRAYNFALNLVNKGSKGIAYLMDMGTGKTITSIALVGSLLEQSKFHNLLIVCPKSIVGVWQEEFQKFADYRYALTILDGSLDKKKAAFKYMTGTALQVIVVNYESCWRLESEIAKWKPDMIICDESSKIKNPTTSQSKALHRLGANSKLNLILTGTPITNNPLDFFSQYKFLDEQILGSSFYLFRNRYAVMGGYQNRLVVGYRHLAELVEKVHKIAYRIKIDDAVELPPFIDETRTITLEPKAQAMYKMIAEDCYAELNNETDVTARNILTQLLRLSQVTGGYIRNDNNNDALQVSSAKMDALEDIVDTCVEEGRKVVVFAWFVPEIEAIARMLQKKGIGYSLIYGATKDRAEQVKKFQEDPETKVFVGQLQTTGMGLTLTAANVAVFYSLDFSYANYEQSRARIHRIGQKEKCLYIHLVCKNTVDEKVMKALQKKGDIAKLMVDDWRTLIDGQD